MAPARTVPRTSLPDQIFRSICSSILSGHYAPGDKLPTQRTLADQHDANMTTVREAVKKLEQLRLVEVRHGDAMRVRDWRRHGSVDIVAHLIFGGVFDRGVLANVMEARRLLLTECARLAAFRAEPEQRARLQELAEQLAGSDGGLETQQVDFEFYEELADASGNLVFALIINSIRDLYLENAATFSAIVGELEELGPLYLKVAESVACGDDDLAATAACELTGLQESRLLAVIGEEAEQ
jgi:GntR family transcriptional repressor for pyruvate dehydrogenase complex